MNRETFIGTMKLYAVLAAMLIGAVVAVLSLGDEALIPGAFLGMVASLWWFFFRD